MLCGKSLSSEATYSGNFLHIEWLSILDNGNILEVLSTNRKDDAHVRNVLGFLDMFRHMSRMSGGKGREDEG